MRLLIGNTSITVCFSIFIAKKSSYKSGALSPPILNERVNANLVPLRGESSESVPDL